MNLQLLNKDIQDFIHDNINSNITDLILKGSTFKDIKTVELVEQIEAKKRSKKKLPTWFTSKKIYFPNKLNIEQTSSETTAKYKASLVSGHNLIDLTGGFGVDCFYFAKQVKAVTHCEINDHLVTMVAHNYKQLEVKNINCINNDGIEALKSINKQHDWIYIDPSRRNDSKGKVFMLADCLPNVPKFLELFLNFSKNIMIKTAPLLDITSGISELKHVKAIHIVAVNTEVKELLWILERDYNNEIEIKTINILKNNNQVFNFKLNEETTTQAIYSLPLTYLYEPNTAILKSGAFNVLAKKLNLKKLHKHSHLYTSEVLIEFPGRTFKVENLINYNKKQFKKEIKLNKANVTTRNFPETVQQIRNKLSIKDGGNDYLFFTTDLNNNKIILKTTKVQA